MSAPDLHAESAPEATVLELEVRNHPGVMTHICGLFARRAYNVEGIACMPLNGSGHSRAWLLVNEDERLDQVVKQVEKLHDVLAVHKHQGRHSVFENMQPFFRP